MLGATAVAAVTGAAGAAAGLGLARYPGMTEAKAQSAPRRESPHASSEVAPGELDEYYVFSSSGQTGEVRILGSAVDARADAHSRVQSLQRTGWGLTNESLKVLTEGLTPESREFLKNRGGTYLNGDLHHPHLSFTDGTYDGRYLFVNDKANTRVGPHPARHHEVRQDHPAAKPGDGARVARAEVPEDRLRLLQRRGPRSDPQ